MTNMVKKRNKEEPQLRIEPSGQPPIIFDLESKVWEPKTIEKMNYIKSCLNEMKIKYKIKNSDATLFWLFEEVSKKYVAYWKYIKSKEWTDKAKAFKKEAHNQCELCHSKKALTVHHTNYKHLHNERHLGKDRDVVVLCRRCHNIIYCGQANPRKKDDLQSNLLSFINNQ